MQALLFALTGALLFCGVQWSVPLPVPGLGKAGLPVCPADLLLGAAFVIAIYLLAKGEVKPSRLTPQWTWVILPGVFVFSWMCAGGGMGGIKETAQLVEIVVAGTVLFSLAARENGEEMLSGAVVFAVTTALLIGCYQRFVAHEPAFGWRGLLDNRNHLGGLLALSIPFMVSEYVLPVAEKPLPLRIAAGVAVVLGLLFLPNACVTAAVMAGTIVALGGGEERGMITGWLRKIILAAVLIAAVVLGGLSHSHSGFAFYRPEGDRYTPSARTKRWQAVLLAVEDNPLLGFGPGRFQQEIGQYYKFGFDKPSGRTDDVAGYDLAIDEPGTQTHWEVAAAETGLVGVAAWLLLFAVGAITAYRHGRPGVAGALLAGSVAGLTVAVWTRAVGVLWAYLLALSTRRRKPL